jgi:major membrane immunogen (membrane-anchored lipoprotein)
MGGLARICKMYGGMTVTDKAGRKVEWAYDYAQDRPRLKSEMTKEEWMASEKAKWDKLKQLKEHGTDKH